MILKTNEHIFTTKNVEDCYKKNIKITSENDYPPTFKWDYSTNLRIEDVLFWEVIHEECGGISGYASWSPYAELYMIHFGFDIVNNHSVRLRLYEEKPKPNQVELFYGPGAQRRFLERLAYFGAVVYTKEHWIDPEDMWLYQD